MKIPRKRPLVGNEFIAIMTGANSDNETLCASLRVRGYTTFRSDKLDDIFCLIVSAAVSVLIISETSPLEVSQELCRMLKKSGALIPIIVLHNGLDLDAIVCWIELGADHCERQPIMVDTLISRINAVSRRLRETPLLT